MQYALGKIPRNASARSSVYEVSQRGLYFSHAHLSLLTHFPPFQSDRLEIHDLHPHFPSAQGESLSPSSHRRTRINCPSHPHQTSVQDSECVLKKTSHRRSRRRAVRNSAVQPAYYIVFPNCTKWLAMSILALTSQRRPSPFQSIHLLCNSFSFSPFF